MTKRARSGAFKSNGRTAPSTIGSAVHAVTIGGGADELKYMTPIQDSLQRALEAALTADVRCDTTVSAGLVEFTLSTDDRPSETVRLGVANDVHIWMTLPGNWRIDSHADDLESLVYEFRDWALVADTFLHGNLVPPLEQDEWDTSLGGVILGR